ncbi:copine, partial [Reticulomyxa filosa]
MAQASVNDKYADTLKEQVQMFLSCQDLVSKDVFGKTDPFVVGELLQQMTHRKKYEAFDFCSHYRICEVVKKKGEELQEWRGVRKDRKGECNQLSHNKTNQTIKQKNTTQNNNQNDKQTKRDNHYPKFQKEFLLDYYFEEEQEIRFDVYDQDKNNSTNLKDHDFVGSCQANLGEL